MGMEPMWRLRIMARVGDAIIENGGLALEDGWSFWTELTKVEEKDRKDGFLGGMDNFLGNQKKTEMRRGVRSWVEKT